MPPKASPPVVWLRTCEGDEQGKVTMQIRIRADDGSSQVAFFPLSLKRDARELVKRLTDYRADLPSDNAAAMAVVEQVMQAGPDSDTVGLRTNKSGWYPRDGRTATEFVFPERSVALKGQDPVANHVRSLAPDKPAEAGSLEQWRRGLKHPCKQSSLTIFAVATAFTGPVLSFFPSATGLLFNFAGDSGAGKTTLLRIAQSVFARAEDKDLEATNVSITGLEEQALSRNEVLLCLDEFGAALTTPKAASALVLGLAYQTREGRGKRRSTLGQDALGFSHASWSTTVLTSSEDPLDTLMGDEKRRVGAQIRYVDILVPARELGGVFAPQDGDKEAREAAAAKVGKTVSDVLKANYGVAAPGFIRGILGDPKARARVNGWYREFIEYLHKKGGDHQSRYLESFAKVYAAGRLAIYYKVAPFKAKALETAVTEAFDRSFLVLVPNSVEVASAVSQLIAVGNDPSRCAVLRPRVVVEDPPSTIVGVRRMDRGTEYLFLPTDRFKKLFPAAMRSRLIALLKEKGALQYRDDADTNQMLMEGFPAFGTRPSGYKMDWQLLNSMTVETPGT